jgi:hypothetical protein
MTEFILTFLVTGLLLFAVLVVVAYLIVRFLFVRMADRISREIAPRLDSAAAGVSRGVASRPRVAQAARVGAAVGRKIRDLAAAQGLDGDDAKRVFLARLDRTERLMDRQISLPLVGGIGLDALLGLIPYVGDAASALVTGSLILNSLQYGLPRTLVAQMVANMFVDLLFGAIPVVGDLFDIAFKANTRNIALLRAHLDRVDRLP